MTDTPEPEAERIPPTDGFKTRGKKAVRQRTNQRTKRGRKPGGKNNKTLMKEALAERALISANGRLAVEEMDVEIARFEELMRVLYPWDANGKQITGKTVQTYFWAAEMRRDYLALRAPYQTPRLSAVALVNPSQGQGGSKTTTVNVTILNERGDKEFSDAPEDNVIEGEIVENDEEAA